ncbi:MAG: hypothetical protein U5K28_04445 [Halobacteriales archaeon]|nr:hypothetical protein [Halobacteriales archaeon]
MQFETERADFDADTLTLTDVEADRAIAARLEIVDVDGIVRVGTAVEDNGDVAVREVGVLVGDVGPVRG